MRRIILAALLALVPAFASAQFAVIAPTPPQSDNGDRIATTAWVNGLVVSGLPLASGKIWIGSAGNIAVAQTPSGDCAISLSGVMTCTKTNGVAFNALATLGVGAGLSSSGGNLILTVPVTVALGGTNCAVASGTCLDNIAGFGSTGLLARTGAGAYSARTIGSGAGISVTNGDGVAGNPSIAVSALSTNTNLLISSGVAASLAANSTEYAGAGAICSSSQEASCPVPISAPATLKNLYAATADAPSAGQTYTFTLRKNLADTTITCVMSGASAKTCNDTTHTVSVVAGDIVDMKMVSSVTATATFGPTFMLTAVTTSP